MHMMIAAALSVFFGGTGMDGMAAALSGAVLYGMLHGSSILKLNTIIQNMLCSAVTAMAVLLLVRMGIGTQPDKIMIGDIMLVISRASADQLPERYDKWRYDQWTSQYE